MECETGSTGSLWGHCNAFKCGNGRRQIDEWESQQCSIHTGFKHNMGQCTCPPPFVLWTFPTLKKDPRARGQWIKLVNRKNWITNAKSRLCSRHFVQLKPTLSHPYPTENMGYKTTTLSRKPPTPRTIQESNCKEPLIDKNMSNSIHDDTQEQNLSRKDTELQQTDHTYSSSASVSVCENCVKLQKQVVSLQQKVTDSSKRNENINKYIDTDKKVNLNTGVTDRATLNSLHQFMYQKAKKMRYWVGTKVHLKHGIRHFKKTPKRSGPKKKLQSFEELVLVLMKLRLGVTNSLLCDMFNISQGLCSKMLNTWIPFLRSQLQALVYWPYKEAILQHMPHELAKKYPQLRCTMDCTEIFIHRPRNLEIQQLTWSDYKKHNTVKYLIAITPNGTISFLSSGYGGRASDRAVVHHSGFLDLVDPGDVILADRGFTIAGDLLQRHARLEIPPPSSGWDQQTKSAVAKTKKVANARIHVERAIGRIKWFTFLRNTVPINMVPLLDDIVVICAALSNLRAPLVRQ